MIEQENTGSLDEVASKLGLKRRQTTEYLNVLANLGKPTIYDIKRKSFVYEQGSNWNVEWPE